MTSSSSEDFVEDGVEGLDETSLKSCDGVVDAPEVGMEFDTFDALSDGKIDAPGVGMEFDSYDALFEYYKWYAKQEGFAVCKRSSKKVGGKMRNANVECYKAGKPRYRSKSSKRPRPQTKIGCPAHVRGCLTINDKWRVSSVCLDHNHEQSPSKVGHLKQYRTIDENTKRQLELHDLAGIKINKTFDVLSIKAGGPERSRVACKEFGDVVTFDTTYLVNKYDMPFAPFVSVNHHGKSVLLGCGLVSQEDTNSFIWLFEAWLACMHDCAPKAIITDQCMAMKKAIECVFPTSRHRWCIWHIMKKLPEKLNGYKEYESISYYMKQAVYSSLTVEEFEDAWLAFITKYELQSNTWLDGLYVERARWVPECFDKKG